MLKSELSEKHAIVYELDLANGIDHAKSPHNELKQAEDNFEFICEWGRVIPFSDIEVIFGQLTEKNACFEGQMQGQSFYKPQENPAFNKIFSALLPLDDEYDIIDIKFRGNREEFFRIALIREYFAAIKKDIKNGVFADGAKDETFLRRRHSPQTSSIYLKINPKKNLDICHNETLIDCMAFEYDCKKTVSFSVDYKKNKLNINQQNWRELRTEFGEPDFLEFNAGFAKKAQSFADDTLDIYQARYAKNTGYVYLKPTALPKGNYKLFLYHAGEVELEYFKKNNWVTLAEKMRLDGQEEVKMRLKVFSGSKVYGLFIAK